MKYNSHVIKLSIFLILCSIGYLIYKKLNIYRENFNEEEPYTPSDSLNNVLCNSSTFQEIINLVGDMESYSGRGGDYFSESKTLFNKVKQNSKKIIKNYPFIKDDLQPLIDICDTYIEYTYEKPLVKPLFYEHINYGGRVTELGKGYHNTSWSTAKGAFPGDTISSIKTNDYHVTIYQHPDKKGKSKQYPVNKNIQFVGRDWNDIISSIVVEPRTRYKDLSGSKFIKIRNKYFNEANIVVKKIKDKYNCFGEINQFNYKELVKKLKEVQNILVLEKIDNNSKKEFNKLIKEIKSIISTVDQTRKYGIQIRNALPGDIKKHLQEIFFQLNNENPTFYTKIYYEGNKHVISPGSYANTTLKNIPEKSISSIKSGGYTVVLYDKSNFRGNKRVIRSGNNIEKLEDWDKKTISFQVIKEDNHGFIISESYFKRKGTAKKIGKWVSFFEKKKVPVAGKDYNVIGNISHIQTPSLSHFKTLKLVSAGSQNAEQEQKNLPNFDIKDKGGFNLFRAVVTRPNVPLISTSFSIKESCMKETHGIPVEVGNTPLVLKNYARSSMREDDKTRYNSSAYFGEPQLFIITNIDDDGINLNNEPKTFYLSNSGNNTRKAEYESYKSEYNQFDGEKNMNQTKALYHIRTYNPNTGKFDYAFDVNSSGNLQPGKINKSLQTSLYVYKKVNGGLILENYGYKGFGQNAGNTYYFKHSFDKVSGKESVQLVTDESKATKWDFSKITA